MDTWFFSQTGEKGRDLGTWLTFGLWKLTQSNTACEHQAKSEWPRLPIPALPPLFWGARGTVPWKGRPKQAEEQKGHSVHLLGTLGCAFSSTGKMNKSILSICFVDIMTTNTFLKCHLALSLEGSICHPPFQKLSPAYHIYPLILRSTQFPHLYLFFFFFCITRSQGLKTGQLNFCISRKLLFYCKEMLLSSGWWSGTRTWKYVSNWYKHLHYPWQEVIGKKFMMGQVILLTLLPCLHLDFQIYKKETMVSKVVSTELAGKFTELYPKSLKENEDYSVI